MNDGRGATVESAVRTVGALRASPSTGWQQVARAEALAWDAVAKYEAAQQGNTLRLVTRDDAPVAPTPASRTQKSNASSTSPAPSSAASRANAR